MWSNQKHLRLFLNLLILHNICAKIPHNSFLIIVQLKLLDLPEGLQVSEESACFLPPVTFLNGHNIRPTFYRPCGWFRTPATEHPGSWPRACTRPTVNITHWSRQFPITASTYLYIDVCEMEHAPVHILRYMGQTSNNKKMLINNSSYCFTI